MATGLMGDRAAVRAAPPGELDRRAPARPARPRAGQPGRAHPGLPPRTDQPRQVPGRAAAAAPAGARSRAPFVLLLIGLLGGGLVSLLVINTTLAQGAFQITAMRHQNATLAQREQALQQQVTQEESPASIAQRAEQLGMRPVGRLRFLDLKTGRILSQPDQVSGVLPVSGYTP